MTLKSVHDVDISSRRLLIRADLNVPMNNGGVADATRIERFVAGLKPLLARGARAVVLSHLGRPDGQRRPELSLEPVAAALGRVLGKDVAFSEAISGPVAARSAAALGPGDVLVCENLRFDQREEANDASLAEELAELGDLYVNDAFSCAHRAHASTVAIAERLPAVAGPLMMAEISALTQALEAPQRPAVALVGGAKVSSKIDVLFNLIGKLDTVIVGGGMANTFLAANGLPIGKSPHESAKFETVRKILSRAQSCGCQIVLPVDIVWADRFERGAEAHIAELDCCPQHGMILDAGPRSIERIWDVLAEAKTILWNGPLGAFEIEPFDHATEAVAAEAARLTRVGKVKSIAGGGDTVAALNAAGVTEDFTYVSTAGGAFLEWLEGKELPGVSVLRTPQLA
ncbi:MULTISPECIES: phosphoglycerate kinase [Nitrobacteraceae]|jgi:phosphoglycerate kinase|uniref:Phosphoglycerate kinase n=1 Tax=Bradyrhizobium denitrificans TaxID=2734912 RepID=A0ABS5GC94_9BRAD|nr:MULTISPECIES: phosphoglycerate kinase [Nitrobacteraceae]ABQ32735.1 phosphoglycerate kinase [Bradyrhizobium sp. BTAi1]MBR1138963.1 phosphoglycerate kinase [Bradyrhizobium denitrificans]NPU26818.1 phosphoglycerate kinase [Bradyrhizobium sp. LMG 8443]CEJ12893.1 Phosphoglycerate kinase [bacterium YEK0313]